MTPAEFKEWMHAFRDLAQEFLPNRDSKLWSSVLTASIAIGVLAHERPDVFPMGWPELIEHWAGIFALVGSKMGWSWAGSPKA